MGAVTETELYAALRRRMHSGAASIDTTLFTPGSTPPSFEGSTTSFPNGRNEKFLDFTNDVNNAYTTNMSAYSLEQGIISFWLKPDFTPTEATDHGVLTANLGRSQVSFRFLASDDDWTALYVAADGTNISLVTTGETWNVDNVIHVVIFYDRTKAIDGSYYAAIYINNTFKVGGNTGTVPAVGEKWSSAAIVGKSQSGLAWDGGLYDLAHFDYTSLASAHTDIEIVQALYSNTLDSGTTHKFVFEIGPTVPTAPSNFTLTSKTSTTASFSWTDNSSNETGFKIYDSGNNLIQTIVGAGTTTTTVTGLSAATSYSFYIVAYNALGNSTASSTLTFNTQYAQSTGMTIKGSKIRLMSGSATLSEYSSTGKNMDSYAISNISSTYTVDSDGRNEYYLRCNGTFTLTLPTGTTGRVLIIKNIGTGIITIGSWNLQAGECITIIYNGSSWEILSVGATLA